MTQPISTLDLNLVFHGSALAGSVPVVMKFCDRGESFKKALEGTSAALETLRKEIAEELRESVAAFLDMHEAQPRVTSLILSGQGAPYQERPAKPAESEAYRDMIHRFARTRGESLSAYHAIVLARDAWSFWARLMGWLVYFFWVWELIVVASLAGFGKMGGFEIANWVFVALAGPSVVGIVAAAVALALSMRWQDRLFSERTKHEKL